MKKIDTSSLGCKTQGIWDSDFRQKKEDFWEIADCAKRSTGPSPRLSWLARFRQLIAGLRSV
jgi:hypothetical protein